MALPEEQITENISRRTPLPASGDAELSTLMRTAGWTLSALVAMAAGERMRLMK
jgi:hypothetical protein